MDPLQHFFATAALLISAICSAGASEAPHAAINIRRPPATSDTEAGYKDGKREFRCMVAENTLYPQEVYDADIAGEVKVRFSVETDGTISEMEIVSSPHPLLSEAVLNSMQAAPAWEPAFKDGKALRSKAEAVIPFSFTKKEVYAANGTPIHTKPKFRGGTIQSFRSWVARQLTYPKEAQENDIEGMVLVYFEISSDGNMENLEVLNFPDLSLQSEVMRVLNIAPKWTPAYRNWEPVKFSFTLPVGFKLRGSPDYLSPLFFKSSF